MSKNTVDMLYRAFLYLTVIAAFLYGILFFGQPKTPGPLVGVPGERGPCVWVRRAGLRGQWGGARHRGHGRPRGRGDPRPAPRFLGACPVHEDLY